MAVEIGIIASSIHVSSRTDISSVIASVVCQLDATLLGSTDGSSQTWANAVASPADGSAQSAYNFNRGATSSSSTDDPTFDGTAGDPGADFSVDGGDYFSFVGASTTFLDSLHKTTGGQDCWFAFALFMNTSTAIQNLFDTTNNFGGPGIVIRIKTANNIGFVQEGGASVESATTATLTDGTINLIIVSFQHSTNTVKWWINSKTATESHTFSPSTTTAGATSVPTLLSNAGGVGKLQSGGKIYGFACGNEFIDDTKATAIVNYYNVLHARTYA